MRRNGQYLLALVIFLMLCITISVSAKGTFLRPVLGSIESILLPVQRMIIGVFPGKGGNKELQALQNENKRLTIALTKYKEQEKENAALRDQFNNSPITTTRLLPAMIVGMRSFIPGFSLPTEITVDKGSIEGVKIGMGVMIQDRAVGKITRVSEHLSQLSLVTASGNSITAKTLEGNALGIVKGQGDDSMLFDNIVLSDKLTVGDTIVTSGDITLNGLGYPPGLVMGKISSIDKKPSALFQTAEVQSAIAITHEKLVFIILP